MHAFLWFIGVSPTPQGTSPMYQLWSGLTPSLVIFGASIRWLGGRECHVAGCHRHGRYDIGPYRVCTRHHPDDAIQKGVTQEHVTAWYNGQTG